MKRRLYLLAIVAVCAIFAGLVLLTWRIAARAGTSEAVTFLCVTLPMVGAFFALAPAFGRVSRRPSGSPRIENLRIAGKYSGKPATMGVSPLDLRF